jgi:hypothetical protein
VWQLFLVREVRQEKGVDSNLAMLFPPHYDCCAHCSSLIQEGHRPNVRLVFVAVIKDILFGVGENLSANRALKTALPLILWSRAQFIPVFCTHFLPPAIGTLASAFLG